MQFDTSNIGPLLDPIICGLEWNLENSGQIDLTWWFSWYDFNSQSWKQDHTTLVLHQNGNNDYWDFYNTFNGPGFYLILNLAEGGDFPGTSDVLVDEQPQYMVIQSVKSYGFY